MSSERGRYYKQATPYGVSDQAPSSRGPTRQNWALFWQTLDRIGVWNWKPDYTDPNVLDGQGWNLEIHHAGHKIKTGGANAYPGVDGPTYSPDTAFGQFLAAVEELTGLPGLS